jgi:hypothetical protein
MGLCEESLMRSSHFFGFAGPQVLDWLRATWLEDRNIERRNIERLPAKG